MTKAEAKEYLSEVKIQKRRILKKLERAEDLLDQAADPGALRYDDIRVQSCGDPDKNMRWICEAIDLQNETIDDRIQLMQMIDERINWILRLSKPLHINLLCEKYIYDHTLEDIREQLLKTDGEQYRYDHLCREHSIALNHLAEIITEYEEHGELRSWIS